MIVEKSGSIRSVERAIDLLAAMNLRPLSTLADLHCDTGLPKPSIVRLLRTLEAKGLVGQSVSYGTYRLLAKVKSLSSGFHHDPEIIEAAEQIMIEFTRREGWPLTLAMFDGDAMVIRASTIPHTSLSLLQSTINMRLSMVARGLGRAYLAHTSPSEQKTIIEMVKQAGGREDAIAHDEKALAQLIRKVRKNGYAMRDPVLDPRSATLGVPVHWNDRVVASLGLTWITTAMPLQQAVDKFAPRLKEIAAAISRELASRARRVDRKSLTERRQRDDLSARRSEDAA
jgi:IclR family mhp operon transcriptional activator